MTRAGLVRASTSPPQSSETSNDGFPDHLLAEVPTRNTPANDNPQLNDLPACLPVTDEEVTLLHRYLSREILGLFS
jgi:hypothetical protein